MKLGRDRGRIATVVALSGLFFALSGITGVPAAAIDMIDVCEDYLQNHFHEAEWENACIDSIKEFDSQCFIQQSLSESECVKVLMEFGSIWTAFSQTTESSDQVSPIENAQSAAASSSSLTVGSNVNMSQLVGNHQEVAIAINPTDPDNLFAFSNAELSGGGVFAGFSMDGGTSWTHVDPTDGVIADGDAGDPLPLALGDPSASWDDFGNLFIAYLGFDFLTHVALSIDGGQSFTAHAALGFDTDQPTITTGANSVWVTYSDGSVGFPVVARGASVTGLGTVGTFNATQVVPGSSGGNFGDIGIGPNGQVLVSYQIPASGQGPATIRVALDGNGLGAGGFGSSILATNTNVGGFDFIPSQPDRSVDAEAGFAYDRSGGSVPSPVEKRKWRNLPS